MLRQEEGAERCVLRDGGGECGHDALMLEGGVEAGMWPRRGVCV